MGHEYEFLGPPGALFISSTITPITYLTHLLLTPSGCPPKQFLTNPIEFISTSLAVQSIFSWRTLSYYLLYFFSLVALQYILPGRRVEGTVLANNTRLTYKINALSSFSVLLATAGVFTVRDGREWWVWVYLWNHNLELITSLNLFALSLSLFLYLRSLRPGSHILAKGGQSGNPLYDWFIGRELNPRLSLLPEWDLKSFCELRPGLILWIILNLSNMAAQLRLHGEISDSMLLTTAFQAWYVIDSHLNEPAVFTTMDITTDGFGHMLVHGDLAWVPLTYSIQTRYLAMHPVHLGTWGVAGVLAVQAVGYYIFRASNSQKNAFRTNPADPAVAHLKTMDTKRGTKLLVSGWWGMARHINYFGDWIMAWAWCLPTGFGTPLTYFYVVYFAILLIHRERRDDEACEKKYGADWEKYRRTVRWRIVPGVY